MSINLHEFARDLKNRPAPGSNAPPRTIRAKDLDDNFRKLILLPGKDSPPLYEVEYKKEGVRITRILPNGSTVGDLLYWNGSRWTVLPAPTLPSSATLSVLTIQNGTLAWTATEDCEE